MSDISIGHAAVTVRDMEESLHFYTEALGLARAFQIPEPETGEPWIVYLNVAPGQFVELFYGGEAENPWRPELLGVQHLCFAVPDIQAAAQKVLDAGYTLDEAPKQGCDDNWQCWTRDPNGVRIELMSISPTSPHAAYL